MSPHESNGLITGPLWVLSFFAVFVGPAERARHREVHRVVRAPVRVPRSARSEVRGRLGRRLGRRRARSGSVRRTSTTGRASGRVQLSERNRLAYAGKQFLVNKYYLDVLYTDIIVGVDQGPDRTRGVLVQPARHRQRPELHRAAARRAGQRHLQVHRSARRRRHRERHRYRHRRSRWRGAPDPNGSPAVLRTHARPGRGRVRPRALDRGLAEGK